VFDASKYLQISAVNRPIGYPRPNEPKKFATIRS